MAFLVAAGAAYWQDEVKTAAERVARERHDAIAAQLASAKQELAALKGVSAVANALVGDLTKLNALGGEGKYYVRIAADTIPARLEPYLDRIERQFAGARSSGLVGIRPPKVGSKKHVLVFGQ